MYVLKFFIPFIHMTTPLPQWLNCKLSFPLLKLSFVVSSTDTGKTFHYIQGCYKEVLLFSGKQISLRLIYIYI